jgi:hypothetical protein
MGVTNSCRVTGTRESFNDIYLSGHGIENVSHGWLQGGTGHGSNKQQACNRNRGEF